LVVHEGKPLAPAAGAARFGTGAHPAASVCPGAAGRRAGEARGRDGAAQGGCGVSFCGGVQALPGRGAVQPALGDPAWAGGWAG